MGKNWITLASSRAPSFISLFLVTDRDYKAGVPFSPMAISVIPNIPSPQFEIKKDRRVDACSRKCNKALAPLIDTALLLMFR